MMIKGEYDEYASMKEVYDQINKKGEIGGVKG
jgi:hypothetical protein